MTDTAEHVEVPASLRRHPNRDQFAWDDHRGPFQAITQQQAAQYDRDGFFVLRNALPVDALASLEAAIDPLERRIADLARARVVPDRQMQVSRPDEISFADHLAAISPEVRAFTMRRDLVRIAMDLVGPDVRIYQEHAVYKKAGAPRSLPWHQDGGYEFTIPMHYVTFWVSITDATVDNGCVWVRPGDHLLGPLDHWPSFTGFVCSDGDDGGVPIETRAGDILVFSSLTPHRSGPNLTGETRKGYIVHYCADGTHWVESQYQGGYKSMTCDDPRRQYLVATGGVALPPP